MPRKTKFRKHYGSPRWEPIIFNEVRKDKVPEITKRYGINNSPGLELAIDNFLADKEYFGEQPRPPEIRAALEELEEACANLIQVMNETDGLIARNLRRQGITHNMKKDGKCFIETIEEATRKEIAELPKDRGGRTPDKEP